MQGCAAIGPACTASIWPALFQFGDRRRQSLSSPQPAGFLPHLRVDGVKNSPEANSARQGDRVAVEGDESLSCRTAPALPRWRNLRSRNHHRLHRQAPAICQQGSANARGSQPKTPCLPWFCRNRPEESSVPAYSCQPAIAMLNQAIRASRRQVPGVPVCRSRTVIPYAALTKTGRSLI